MASDIGDDELADYVDPAQESCKEIEEDEEVDELEEDSDGAIKPGALEKAVIASLSPEVKARWTVAPGGFLPHIEKRRHRAQASRERAQVRKREKKELNGAEKAAGKPTRSKGKQKVVVRTPGKVSRKPTLQASFPKAFEDLYSSSEVADELEPEKESDSDSETAPPRKRSKTVPSGLEFTAYIAIEHPVQPPPHASRARFTGSKANKQACIPKIEHKGPVLFDDKTSFQAFLTSIAKACACEVENLATSDLAWKLEKPANSVKKPLRCEDGYVAMLRLLREQPKGRVVIIHVPPPALQLRTTASVHTSTFSLTGPSSTMQSEHPYEDMQAAPAAFSVNEQILSMNRALQPLIVQLEARYPLNNIAHLFPGKRIYAREGRYWELTTHRLQAWARAIERHEQGVNFENPPHSIHFSDKQRIHPPANPSATTSGMSSFAGAGTSMTHANGTMSVPFGTPMMFPPAAYMYPPFPPAMLSYFQMPHASALPGYHAAMNSYSPHLGVTHAMFPEQPHLATPGSSDLTTGENSTNHSSLSIPEFCMRYQIPDADCGRLLDLNLPPGDPGLDKIPEARWKALGFSRYGWQRVCLANMAFIEERGGDMTSL